MERELKSVIRRYAIFLVLFSIVVFLLWAYGADIFALLLRHSRAYTPPQFLTWLSLASSISMAVAFCAMPFLLFRIVRERPHGRLLRPLVYRPDRGRDNTFPRAAK